MLGFGSLGEFALGEIPAEAQIEARLVPSLSLASLIIPENKVSAGVLVASTSVVWDSIVKELGANWDIAYKIPSEKWEELVASAFKKDGYDEVVLTPRSGDFGRDVIATKRGFGCVKILGSVKAYAPNHLGSV